MHSGGGVTAVQSRCSFKFNFWSGMHANRNYSMWRITTKSNPVLETRGERWHSSKESSLQGLASEQSRIFVTFVVRWDAQFCSPHGENVQNAFLREFRTERISDKFNVTFLPLRHCHVNTSTCFSKDAENLTTHGYVLWCSQIVCTRHYSLNTIIAFYSVIEWSNFVRLIDGLSSHNAFAFYVD